MNKKWYIVFAIVIILSQQLGYIGHAMGIKGVWYVFNAFSHFGLWVTLFFLATSHLKQNSWAFHVTWYGCLLAINQFVDEMVGSASETNLNEIIVACIIVLHLTFTLYGRGKQQL